MPKVCLFFILAVYLSLFFSLGIKSALAYDTCSMRTEPAPIYGNTSSAKFIVNVGDSEKYQNWTIDFECSLIHNSREALKLNDHEIYREIGNNGCEFSEGKHTLFIQTSDAAAIRDTHFPCRATYNVDKTSKTCTLQLSKTDSIKEGDPLTVSSQNLANGGQFILYIDTFTATKALNRNYLHTPDFSLDIPTKFVTKGTHTLSVVDATDQSRTPLCQVTLPVGTEDQPGGPATSGNAATGTTTSPNKLPAAGGSGPTTGTKTGVGGVPLSSGAGVRCVTGFTDAKGNPSPSIDTAIGCIPTEPVALIKAFLRFTLAIAGGIAFLIMIFGVFQMITSAGNPDRLKQGSEMFTNAIIGLLFIIFAVLLLQIIGAGILNIPGFI